MDDLKQVQEQQEDEFVLLYHTVLCLCHSSEVLSRDDAKEVFSALKEFWALSNLNINILEISLQIPLLLLHYGLWDDPKTVKMILTSLQSGSTEEEIKKKQEYFVRWV